MKKKVFLLVGVATLLAFQACQESTTVNGIEKINDSSNEIHFTNYVSGLTRASRKMGATFVNGDIMQVHGFQILGDSTALLFNKQKVSSDGEDWSYSPIKYWEKNSTYDFYAIFPYSTDNSFDNDERLFTVNGFTVQDNADDQIDLMIAKQITGHQPYNVVPFEFNHILSNVNFYVKIDDEFNTEGITGLNVTNFDVTGLYGKGTFVQSGWDNGGVFTGQWTPVATSEYDLPAVTNALYTLGESKATIVDDLLLLPQQINDNAQVTITFQLLYEDSTASAFTRTIALNKIVGKKAHETKDTTFALAKWEPNFRYNYTIAVNPAITEQGGQHLPVASDNHSQTEYNDPDNHIPPTVNLIEYDSDGDGEPELWVDSTMNDKPDYPVIWEDIDGDGWEEALPDRDGDGKPDYTNGSDEPDVIWIDTDGDGKVDQELERKKTNPSETDPDLPDNPDDPTYPDTAFVDYDGAASEGYQKPIAWLVTDADGEQWIDTDNDGQGDIKVVWKDIDGDGKLEGIADKDQDGKATENDNYDGDHKDYLGNDNEYDVILYTHMNEAGDDYEKDADGNIVWYELEKEIPEVIPDIPEVKTAIEFSATVTDWDDDYDAEFIIKE